MLFAPTATKHNLAAPSAVGGLSNSNCGDIAVANNVKHQAAALLNNGLRCFNHQQHRQHHNQKEQRQQQQQQPRDQQQQSKDDSKVQLKQPNHQQQVRLQQHHQGHDSHGHNLPNSHVPNLAKNEHQHYHQQHQQEQQQQKQKQHQLQQQQQLTMEAMSKLDATLAAYLAGEKKKLIDCNGQNVEQQQQHDKEDLASVPMELCSMNGPSTGVMFEQLELFKCISGIKLQMEALTLQSEGTKRMELLQNDIRPIFTVECQLSHELIKAVPRYDMFHIMQFESEKFHSLTQCSRFGQEAERAVKLNFPTEEDAKNNNTTDGVNDVAKKPNLGRIHFTVWWREPGTCLNEMLGTGVLALEELYAASVFEQCKNIIIQRRKVHLANLYFKISLQIGSLSASSMNMERDMNMEYKTVSSVNVAPASSSSSSSSSSSAPMNNATADAEANLTDTNPCGADTSTKYSKSDNTGDHTNSGDNDNNIKIETTNFIAETSRVRLLRGYIYASEVRQLDLYKDRDYLVCRRFWEDELAVKKADVDNKFNYQEQFAVLNDDAFLQRVERQHLQLELWRRQSTPDTEGNDNLSDIQPFGIARLPLHQFFIAYRDMEITNHLCKGKLPVVSFDAWAPIISSTEMGRSIGELRCMLAIGSDEQIAKLKETHGYADESVEVRDIDIDKTVFLQRPTMANDTPPQRSQLQRTANLLEFLQRSLNAQPPCGAPPPPRMPPETSAAVAADISSATSSAPSTVSPSLLKPLQMSNVKSFRFLLEIQRANGLPRNPGVRGKKSSKRNSASKQQRFPPNEAPSTYVTFQADEGFGPVYKSHEGAVYATNIVEKSTQPQWEQRFRISASVDYLLNPQKRFILKVWKKAATDSPQKRQQPTPLEDAIVGFAALDLNVFMRGLYLSGCFNIVDFNGRINGQLEVRSQPLENVQHLLSVNRGATVIPHYQQHQHRCHQQSTTASVSNSEVTNQRDPANVDNFIDEFDNALGLAHLNLGQAIKRKFNELEGISQRLRTRLVDVTGEQLAPEFNASLLDDWLADKDNNVSMSELDDFEHDINTVPVMSPQSNDNDNIDDEAAAQNDKAQFKIASIASASVDIERKDEPKSMAPKE